MIESETNSLNEGQVCPDGLLPAEGLSEYERNADLYPEAQVSEKPLEPAPKVPALHFFTDVPSEARVGGFFGHYKDEEALYVVISIGPNRTTGVYQVVYMDTDPTAEDRVHTRDLADWNSPVNRDGEVYARFFEVYSPMGEIPEGSVPTVMIPLG